MKPRLNRNLRQNSECMLSVVLKTCSFYIIYLLWIVKQTFFPKKKKACFFSLWLLLRGPAPKKRPMISGSKLKSADFYLPSRSYRILFKNEFLLFQFRFKPKISSRKLFPSDSSKIRPKISPRKNGSEITIATQNNEKITQWWRKRTFNAISVDKHRKTAEGNKK